MDFELVGPAQPYSADRDRRRCLSDLQMSAMVMPLLIRHGLRCGRLHHPTSPGLRVPQSGLLLLDGLDLQTVGSENWRRAIVAAPQFHENYVLTETFAFNLLMSRRWPPEQEDLDEAKSLCQELGLAELVNRMPAGLFQMIGETGWQLSHGERSRLYIARALLQHGDIIVLDESFAALDPANLRQCVSCVLKRSPTLLVIAHP
jgi:ATP-binding cassette, subfamily B, bacterial